jgi:hypothetical protein
MFVANQIPGKAEDRPLVTLDQMPVLACFAGQNPGNDLQVIDFQRSSSICLCTGYTRQFVESSPDLGFVRENCNVSPKARAPLSHRRRARLVLPTVAKLR